MKKTFLLILFAQIIFFVLIPPFQIPDEQGHYENVFWLSRGKYPYQLLEKNKTYSSYFQEIEKYYPLKFSVELLKNNPLRKKTETEFEKKIPANYQPINFQAYHPFLYYLILTPAMFLANFFKLDLISRFYLTRFLSALFFWIILFSIVKSLSFLRIKDEDRKAFLIFF